MQREQSHQGQAGKLSAGVLLVTLGVVLLGLQLIPDARRWVEMEHAWPLIVLGVGVMLFVLGLAARVPAMAIPAAVLSGIGALLFWQNATGAWDSWAYSWTLIPGFVGVGWLATALLGGDRHVATRQGLRLIVISAVLFLVFGSFFGALGILGPYWPAGLILLGAWLFVRAWMSPPALVPAAAATPAAGQVPATQATPAFDQLPGEEEVIE